MHVAEAATSTTRHHHLLVFIHKISNDGIRIRIAHNRAARHRQVDIITFSAMHLLSYTRAATFRFEVVPVAIIYQRIQIGRSLQIDATTSISFYDIRTTERRELLPTKMTGTIAAITGLHKYFRMVVKHWVILNIFFTLWKSPSIILQRTTEVTRKKQYRAYLGKSDMPCTVSCE